MFATRYQFGPNPMYYITFGHVYTSWLVLTFKSRITNFYETFPKLLLLQNLLRNLTPSAKWNTKENTSKNRSSHQRCSVKKRLQLYQKDTPTQLFSCEICPIFKNTYFEENLQTTVYKTELLNSFFMTSHFNPFFPTFPFEPTSLETVEKL